MNNDANIVKESTSQKMKFSIKDFISKCDRIRRKQHIWSHLLKKSLMGNFIFCAVQGLPSLINISSCGPHIVHKALKTPVTATKWSLNGTSKSIYTLLHETHATRTDYVSITECGKFPFAYCATLWVKDKKVGDRAVEIWPKIKKVVEKWEKLAPSKRPKVKNIRQFLQLSKITLL